MRHIRIIEVPPGEAPAHIRQAWVGVTLELADIPEPQPHVWIALGVLRKDKGLLAGFKRLFGILIDQPNLALAYVVDAMTSIEALRAQSPSAAKWWERHTPHLLQPGQRLCFDASCCEEIAREADSGES